MFDSSARVLIVDDMRTMRRVILSFLREMGITQIIEAQSGEEALRELEKVNFKVDLIISDWTMQPINGMDFFKALKKDPRATGIPFIMLTAEAEMDAVKSAILMGVDGYITKPVNASTFADKVSQVGIRALKKKLGLSEKDLDSRNRAFGRTTHVGHTKEDEE